MILNYCKFVGGIQYGTNEIFFAMGLFPLFLPKKVRGEVSFILQTPKPPEEFLKLQGVEEGEPVNLPLQLSIAVLTSSDFS